MCHFNLFEYYHLLDGIFLIPWEGWATIGTFTAAFIALWTPYALERIRKQNLKSDLQILNHKVFDQDLDAMEYKYGRLLIKNSKKGSKAIGVQANVINLIENGNKRKNFLSIPLSWTHGQLLESGVIRDINPDQTAYLDVFCFNKEKTIPYRSKLTVCSPISHLGHDDFTTIQAGITTLDINIYQETGQTIIIKITIDWDGLQGPKIIKVKTT